MKRLSCRAGGDKPRPYVLRFFVGEGFIPSLSQFRAASILLRGREFEDREQAQNHQAHHQNEQR